MYKSRQGLCALWLLLLVRDCVDRTAAIDSLWQATMKCISTISIFLDQVPLIGNNFLQHSSSLLECLESILSVGRDSHKIEFHSTMHHQQHDAERESWMNLIDWHFSFCCCFSFAEFIHDQSAAVARHTYCEFDRTESNFCFFPSHQHPPSPNAWSKACVWYHIPPTTIRRCLQNNRTISSKRISQTLKIFIPMKLFSKEFRSTWRWRLMCHTFHLLQFLFCGIFFLLFDD